MASLPVHQRVSAHVLGAVQHSLCDPAGDEYCAAGGMAVDQLGGYEPGRPASGPGFRHSVRHAVLSSSGAVEYATLDPLLGEWGMPNDSEGSRVAYSRSEEHTS